MRKIFISYLFPHLLADSLTHSPLLSRLRDSIVCLSYLGAFVHIQMSFIYLYLSPYHQVLGKDQNNEPSMVDQNPFMVIIVVIINMIMVIISLWTCQLKPFFSKSIEKKYAFMYIVYNWSIHKKWMYNIIICIKGLLTKKIFIIYHTWYIT